MNLRQKIVEAAASELGVSEEGGNNVGPRIRVFQSATWLEPGAWPWCAAFTAHSLRTALAGAGVDDRKALAWRCRDASAMGWVTWGTRAAGCKVLKPDAEVLPGDFVVFDFNGPTAAGGGHIGIVERVGSDGTIYTIEGNTNDAGARDSTNGDGVVRKTRSRKTVVAFIRVPETLL